MAVSEVIPNHEPLSGLLTPDTGLQGWLETVLKSVLEAQIREQIGALPHEPRQERCASRHGSHPRTLYTGVGLLVPRVSQVQDGGLSPAFCVRYQERGLARGVER